MRAVLVLTIIALSGCLGSGGDAEPLDADGGGAADPGAPNAPDAEALPENAEVVVGDGGFVLVQRFSGGSEVVETALYGGHSSLGGGIRVADVQVPDNATVLQFELAHTATFDANPYVLAPRQACGGDKPLEPQSAGLTAFVREEPDVYAVEGDGATVVMRLDADVLARYDCAAPCKTVAEPEYDVSCQTWRLGFRVDPVSAPFSWDAGLSLAVGTDLAEDHRVLE